MLYAGIDLHRRFLIVAVEDQEGKLMHSKRYECRDTAGITAFFSKLGSFKAVIESSSSYRWLYDLISQYGEVVLAHPYRLRAIVAGRAKTDKLDARMLARLLRIDMIPRSYVPPQEYQALRDMARMRARLVRDKSTVKNQLHSFLSRSNIHSPYVNTFCKKGREWIRNLDWNEVYRIAADEMLERLRHFDEAIANIDEKLRDMMAVFPEVEVLEDIYGIGSYSALLIVGELGEPGRFNKPGQVGAYAGLTARVSQSGEKARYGRISRQGSPWLRWILVEAAMKVIRKDRFLGNLYERIRKRSGNKTARVAVARKLAEICWKRLVRWHNEKGVA